MLNDERVHPEPREFKLNTFEECFTRQFSYKRPDKYRIVIAVLVEFARGNI